MRKVSSKEEFRDMILNGEDIEQVDYSHITDMSWMFHGCSSLKEIPHLDTSKVTDMSYMFYECSSLTEIPHLDTSKVTDISEMFYGCNNLEHIEDPHDFHLYDWSDEDAPKNDILLDKYPDLYI